MTYCNARIPPLVYHTVLFALVIVIFFRSRSDGIKSPDILVVLVRDGTWSFAILFGQREHANPHYLTDYTFIAGILWAALTSQIPTKGDVAVT